jgi:PAB-dependent poly(A)-specific ribonuclease subunit 3
MLKLFRDYVFHQITVNGQPWIDLAHIVQCLNKVILVLIKNFLTYHTSIKKNRFFKFDTGSSEKICLVSPDHQNMMIVSYAQLKKCFDKAFNEITAMMNT